MTLKVKQTGWRTRRRLIAWTHWILLKWDRPFFLSISLLFVVFRSGSFDFWVVSIAKTTLTSGTGRRKRNAVRTVGPETIRTQDYSRLLLLSREPITQWMTWKQVSESVDFEWRTEFFAWSIVVERSKVAVGVEIARFRNVSLESFHSLELVNLLFRSTIAHQTDRIRRHEGHSTGGHNRQEHHRCQCHRKKKMMMMTTMQFPNFKVKWHETIKEPRKDSENIRRKKERLSFFSFFFNLS